MRHFFVSDLAHVLLKNHFELRDVAAHLFPSSPFNLALDFGSGRCSRMSVGMQDGQLCIAFTESDRAYALSLPMKSGPDGVILKVTLTENGNTSTQDIRAEEFFGTELPESFRALHEKVAQYLKSLLPASFFAKKATAATETKQAAEPAPSPAPAPAEAEASAVAEVPAAPADEYRTYLVRRQEQPDVRFKGKLIASADTYPRNGRQHHAKVFQTPGGKFVGLKLGTSMWPGESDRAIVQVADTAQDLVAFFGYNALAKALYSQLSLTHEEVVE